MSVVGQSVPQVDGANRVSGNVDFVLNLSLPRMAYARVLRSPHPHARIVSIDTSAAQRAPGVVAVLTRDDFAAGRGGPKSNFGRMFMDQDIVALERVRYVGDPVAAVAATSELAASEALSLIDVEYEPLPAVFTIEDALAPDAPLVHSPRPPLRPQAAGVIRDAGGESNLCSYFRVRQGDVARALAEAAHVREDTYTTAPVQHVALEPHVSLADVSAGSVTVWTAAQMPHAIRASLADLFGLPLSRVRVIVGPVGGGFGAKGGVKMEPLACALSWKAGRPVKLVLPRDEEFVTLTRHPSRIRITTGLSSDGRIVGRRVEAHYNTGAYADVGPTVARNAGLVLGGPYRLPNIEIDSWTVWTNLVPAGAFRGFGVPQACWAHESHLDALAEQAGFDPAELRSMNLLRDGDRYVTGEAMHDIQYERLLESATRAIGWSARTRPQGTDGERSTTEAVEGTTEDRVRRGKGLAMVIKATITPSTSSAILRLNADGSLNVLASGSDIGQGVKTVLAQIAADAVGTDLQHIEVSDPDTQLTPFDQQTSSSRITFSVGTAVKSAGMKIREQLVETASGLLEVAPGDLVVGDGRVSVVGSMDRHRTFAQIVAASKKGNLIAEASFTTDGGLRLDDGQGVGSAHWHQGAVGCEVEVDVETGRISVLDLHVAAYVGRAVNPRLCELQVEGSALFGLGQSLFEEIIYDQGQVTNPNLSDYPIPSPRDVPARLGTSILEGAANAEIHGIGETGLPPILPAIGNAVADAIGVRLTELPMTAERVLKALRASPPVPSR